MKTAKIIFGIIFLIIVVTILHFRPKETSTPVIPEVSEVANGKYCFGRSQEATASAPYSVEEHMIVFVSGNSVSGTKSGTQSGPDMTNGYGGSLEGTRSGNIFELFFSYTIEGSENREKELYAYKGENLEKSRYVLKEEKGILVPDLSTSPQTIVYVKEACTE
jgi:hypothetical protein